MRGWVSCLSPFLAVYVASFRNIRTNRHTSQTSKLKPRRKRRPQSNGIWTRSVYGRTCAIRRWNHGVSRGKYIWKHSALRVCSFLDELLDVPDPSARYRRRLQGRQTCIHIRAGDIPHYLVLSDGGVLIRRAEDQHYDYPALLHAYIGILASVDCELHGYVESGSECKDQQSWRSVDGDLCSCCFLRGSVRFDGSGDDMGEAAFGRDSG